jgi:hypothetical protein
MPMRLVQLLAFSIGAGVVAPAGCGAGASSTGQDAGADGGPGGAGAGGGDAGNTCAQCAPGPANGWDFPVLLWIGAEKDAPQCPVDAPAIAFEGHANLNAPINCGTCTCTPPTGSCSQPATMTANAATCALNGGSTPHTPFDPSSDWTGACDTNESIPSGKLCSGVQCVQSLTIGSLTVKDTGGCTPSQPPTQSPPTWQTFARACQAVPRMGCNGGAGICLAAAPLGYRTCIYHDDDVDCPNASQYTDKSVFYAKFQDTRACSLCTCGTPSGSTCSSTVSIYTDGACSTLAYSATIDATGPACNDLPAGVPLGSKSATPPTYTPGACQPDGGQPMGAATVITPSTYCCLPGH